MSDLKELLLRFEGMWIMKLERWKQAMDGPLLEEALRRKLERLGYSVTR